MTRLLEGLGAVELERLAGALEGRRVNLDSSSAAIRRVVARELADQISAELRGLAREGLVEQGAALLLRSLAAERRALRASSECVELVWTDPEEYSARDTSVVVRGLCARARGKLLLANYAFDQPSGAEARERAQALWAPLATNMDVNPGLRVRMIVNVRRDWKDTTSTNERLIAGFRRRFQDDLWPGQRLPEFYHDPRSLMTREEASVRSCMHAKCIVVDEAEVLITSANFTQAAQVRNIETGVLVRDRTIARRVIAQFEGLVKADKLVRI